MRFIACGLLLAGLPLLAGKRIQSETTDAAGKATKQTEMLVDSNRLRVNDGNTSVIFLTDGGSRMIMLDKSRNEYREMDEATMKQFAAQLESTMAQLDAMTKNLPPEQRAMMEKMMKGKMPQANAPVRTTYTAKGGATVNGFRCTNYEGVRSGQKVADVCAAQASDLRFSPADYQVFEKMRAFAADLIRTLQNTPFASAGLSTIGDAGFEGFPVQQTSYTNGRAVEKTELKSITDANFSDSDFSVGDARKVELPIPAGKQVPSGKQPLTGKQR